MLFWIVFYNISNFMCIYISVTQFTYNWIQNHSICCANTALSPANWPILTPKVVKMRSKSQNAQTSQSGQIHSNNSSAVADELFECVRRFVGLACKGLRKHKSADTKTNWPYIFTSKVLRTTTKVVKMSLVEFILW